MEAQKLYGFDLDDITKAFPDPSGVPPLLERFGAWLADKPWRSVGSFSLARGWADSEFAGGEDFYRDFAMFVWLPTGSIAGYWLKDGTVAEAPIVLFGSEGEREVLAPNLPSFLARVALGDFEEKGAAADFLYSDWDFEGVGLTDLRGDMAALLRRETGIEDLAALAAKAHPASTEFADWVNRIEAAHRARLAQDPAMRSISDILHRYRPAGADRWASAVIDIRWAGDAFEGVVLQNGPKILPEAAALRPHLAALRDGAARRVPGLGLWHQATLFVYADMIEYRPDYSLQPKFLGGNPPDDAYRADHLRLPREKRRIPVWLEKVLAS
jgi:hypothetical protein